MRRAVFLDRDGTINVEKNYLYRPEDFEFLPGAVEAIRKLNAADFLVVVVTNQSGVARGYYTEADVEHLHRHMDELLMKAGARVDAYYFCPHHPDATIDVYRLECDCRKGEPGMLLQAAETFAIDLYRSWIVGDKPSDVEAGLRAGVSPVLVTTGYGADAEGVDAVICADLAAAVDHILDSEIAPL